MKRHPMYERSKVARFFGYFMIAFWAGYLIFFGVSLALALETNHRDAFQLLNAGGLVVILALDFLTRLPLQRTPTQEVKPYLLLPIKQKRLIDFLLLRSGLDWYNLFWMFFFVPFAILAVAKFFGPLGVVAYLFGLWLLILVNNYWYLLCRTLINESLWWIVLPTVFYLGIGTLLFLPDSPVFYFFMDLGQGYIDGNLLWYLGTLLVIGLLWLVNRRVIGSLVYAELAKTNDSDNVKRVSEYKFLERYGEVGEYMRLELKQMLRNRRCKMQMRMAIILIVMFSLLLSFTEAYDGKFMNTFVCVYSFTAYGIMFLSQLMSSEGNYIDGLMVRKESIMSLLRAKYYVYSVAEVIPFVLMIPAIVTGKLSLLGAFSLCFYTIGLAYFAFFQLAVYNKQSLPMNEKMTMRQTNNGIQIAVTFATFLVPVVLYQGLDMLLGQTMAYVVLLLIGLGFTLTSPLWIKNVYHRFMLRRYENMEGFRDSRQ
ncbi:MAG: DUF5687 family protein [Mediterranea sp.]|jgi:hypothetical protein|nr:DUF5687 family protein [Mediterranea sp.]